MIELYDHQLKAVEELKNGSILCGGVGTGKSRTALAYYYFKECQGEAPVNNEGKWAPMKKPRDLYIITTAKKRDSYEWDLECGNFLLCHNPEDSINGVSYTVDSWNNIKKYASVCGVFFIFDEQRVVGWGSWTKSFLKIANRNHWILLSATPGDKWTDYLAVFIANGFYKNKTEFNARHCVFSRFAKYPKIERFVGVGELMRHRDEVLVGMSYTRMTIPHHIELPCEYDRAVYFRIARDRWNVYENEPVVETGKLGYLMRRVVNEDPSRIEQMRHVLSEHDRCIVFYNFNYERDALRRLAIERGLLCHEWNGDRHEPVPTGNEWMYLVQYLAGAEGWNCITTDTIVFYSQNYSYRTTTQAEGRIDRMNTTYRDLYYYHLVSKAPIDIAIKRALRMKKDFNEGAFIKKR